VALPLLLTGNVFKRAVLHSFRALHDALLGGEGGARRCVACQVRMFSPPIDLTLVKAFAYSRRGHALI
jgi:hypothetical protein